MLFNEDPGAPDGGAAPAPAPAPAPEATPPAEATPSPYEGVFDGEGNFAEGWGERLPEEYRTFAKTTGTPKNLPELVKSYAHLRTKLGDNTVVVPREGASEDEISAFRAAIGVPEDPSVYGLTNAPEGLPEGVSWDSEFGGKVQAWAHAHNVPPAAVKALVGLQLEYQQGELASLQAAQAGQAKEWDDGLRQVWGASYRANQETVDAVVTRLGGNAEDGVFAHPEVRKVLAAVGQRLSEGRVIGMEQSGGNSPLGPLAQAQDIQTNPANPLYASYQRGDDAAVAEVNRLYGESERLSA